MKRSLILLLVLAASSALAQTKPTPAAPPTPQAQMPARPDPKEQLAAMAKLDYMYGRWVGEGWMDMGSTRATFQGSETVTAKLNGLAMMVEGDFSSRGIPVHQTLGVISFDPKTKTYRFDYWLANGSTGQRELTVTERGWSWMINMPGNQMRYTFSLTKSGDWLEIGERSTDGTTWKQFFEMKLSKEL